MMNKNAFDSHKWQKAWKQYTILKEKDEKVTVQDLLHTDKVDGKKADKVDIKIGAENDLAIEKDKDGMDVYAGGLREAYELGQGWSDDFDYVGMLKVGSQATYEMGLENLQKLYDSFEDVNYHRESQDLGNALDWMADMQGIEDEEKVEDFMERFRKKCMATLDVMGIKWSPKG